MLHPRPAAITLLALCGLAHAQQAPVRYDGHRAVRVTVSTPAQLRAVRALADDILTCEGSGLGSFDVRLSPEHYAALIVQRIPHQVLIPDIQRHLDQIRADDAAARAADDPAWFTTYRSTAEIEARLQALAAAYPALATVSQVGTSVQGRAITMIRITGPGSTATRGAFIINATQHAREWVTPMGAMYIADRFLETYATDPRIQAVVNGLDFYIIPVANPDGYEYTRNTNSQWRKNRRDNPGSCDGVDLNRNWGFQWGYDNLGSSGNTCSETYRGASAFSEPESSAIKALADSLAAQGRLRVHWDVHSNGQAILSPWGYTTSPEPPALPLMNSLGQMIHDGMLSVRGTNYPFGQGSVILYLANGCTRDYSYGVHGAMAWTIELSGSSFQPATSQILPIAQELLAGLLPLAEHYLPPPPPPCYPNCDASTAPPMLNVLDFGCFLNRYSAGDSYANCDSSTIAPVLNVLDFNCFLNAFAQGCP